MLRDIQARLGLRRVIFVGDRAMVTSANLERVRAQAHGYIVGLNRRRRQDIQHYLERATGPLAPMSGRNHRVGEAPGA